MSYEAVSPADYSRARRLDRVTLGSAPCTHMWRPDYRQITDVKVRQAIGYAYPYKEAARREGLIFGVTALPGTSILPPSFPGRLEYTPLETQPGRTDPAKAKALLKEAGYAPGDSTPRGGSGAALIQRVTSASISVEGRSGTASACLRPVRLAW